ncbi:MAG: sensor domain-containing diguanylate cyclase, partial [Syntrophomonadaceae bacterium]|nr:sensor domain-containing diguanylate cyclase [Syntrophomonadaceae bacterium]
MRNKKGNISIRGTFLLIFVIALFISVFGYGSLVFINWIYSSKKTTERIATHINEDICEKVIAFSQVPYHVNEVNHKVIENGMLDLSDEKQRERFFVGVLGSHSYEIYSFGYGTAAGEYHGARKNANDVIEIMRNNADASGNSWCYSVKGDLTAGEPAVQAGPYDP